MIYLFLFFSFVAHATPFEVLAPAPKVVWSLSEGLQQPRAVYFDVASEAIYVANEGSIAKLYLDGTMADKRWATTLEHPMAMRSYGESLWVVDGTKLLEFALNGGGLKHKYEISGAKNLSDLAIWRDGTIYLADPTAEHLFRFRKGKTEVVFEKFYNAHGVFVLDDALYGVAGDAFYALDPITEGKKLLWRAPSTITALEYSSSKAWLFLVPSKGRIFRLEGEKATTFIYSLGHAGRFSYMYNADTRKDLLLLPFANANKVEALLVGR